MIKRRKLPKIFFGWWIVLTGGILALWGHGYHAYGFSALFKPIASELGFSRAVTATPAAIGRLEGGFEGPLSGWITDRFGPKLIVLLGVFAIGLSLILMNFVNSLWAYYLVWGVMLGTGINIALSIPLDTAIANWFVKKRGLALSIKWVFSGLSGVLVLPLIAWLITVQGWRVTCIIGGVVMLVVGLPLAWFCLRRYRPEYYGLLPDGATTKEEVESSLMIDRGVRYAAEHEEVEFTLRQAMRTRAFWLMIAAHCVHGLVYPVMHIHCIPFLTDLGIEPVKAAGMMAMYVLVSIPSRFVGGLFADRVKKDHLRFIMGGCYFTQAIGVALFLQNQSIGMIYVFFILYGLGMGAPMPVFATMVGRYFGRKSFGSIQGTKMMLMTPVSVIAPIYVGWIYDTTGSYMTAFILLAVFLASAAVLMALIRPPKPPAQITDIHKLV